MKGIEFSLDIGSEKMTFNTGYLAKQADGSVFLTYGETVIFASAVASRSVKEGQDFFPLSVDYREKTYAAGKFPGGFIKRETRQSDKEVLTGRLCDRPMRPLFPEDFLNEVQVILYTLSADAENQQDVAAINAASAAVMISGIPFHGPVGAVRVGRVGGEWIINPKFSQMPESDIDLIVAGTIKAVTMIEGSSKNVSEDDMIKAIELAHEQIKRICKTQEEFAAKISKPTMSYTSCSVDSNLKNEIKNRYFSELENLKNFTKKKDRENAYNAVKEKGIEELKEAFPDTIKDAPAIFDSLDGEIVRKRILDEGKRADGRTLEDIRQIDVLLGVIPRAHGSAVFTRGETQSLGITTLGTGDDAQKIDSIEGESKKTFMLHYNFPPFSVGETGRTGFTGRREIGHGMLAERSLEYVVPNGEAFPYTVRQVSEILESNGSSSMASVCSGSLSMFNAGVPLKAAVAGIAMGLVMEGSKFAVLSDILGLEDHLGDMDFKVAGTDTGITAFQLDIKIEGITIEIMKHALEQARKGRLKILEVMNSFISAPEKTLSKYAPKIRTIKINPDKIGGVIGSGGKIIKKIIEDSGANVSIEDDGTITISAVDQKSIDAAADIILSMIQDVEVDKIYMGTVKRITDYGAFVEILPGKEGLLHVSKLDVKRVTNVTDIVNVGDKVKVKVLKIDDQGRLDLSRKDALNS